MNSEEGYNRAVLYNETVEMDDYKHFKTFLGAEIDVKEAVEPSDIIWENRNFTENQRTFKKIIVTIIVAILLSISFAIIFICQKKSLAFKNKYPRVKCSRYQDNYLGHHDEWKDDAIREFVLNRQLENAGSDTNYEGTLQCFCETEKSKLGVSRSAVYEQYDKDGETTFSEPICWDIFKDKLKAKVLGGSIAFIIVTVNIVLKLIIVHLCIWVGEETQC